MNYSNQKNSKIAHTTYQETEDEEEIEEETSEKDAEVETSSRVFNARTLAHEKIEKDEEDEDDISINENEDTEEADEEEQKSGDVWSKRVIIKNLPPLDILVDKKSKP